MTAPMTEPSALVRPFTVAFSDSEIEDLRASGWPGARWPNPETVSDWSPGVRLENARSLIDCWEREYDRRTIQSELESFSAFPDRGRTGWMFTSSTSSPRIRMRCPSS